MTLFVTVMLGMVHRFHEKPIVFVAILLYMCYFCFKKFFAASQIYEKKKTSTKKTSFFVRTSASVAADLKSNQTLKELKLSRNELNAESAKLLGQGISENRSPLTFRSGLVVRWFGGFLPETNSLPLKIGAYWKRRFLLETIIF